MVEQRDGQRLRMIDVARKAGVSTATVGRVLHNRGYVSEETRQRVEKAIQDTDFQINLVAQSLRRQRTRTIGHILSNLLPNPFFAGVEVGVQEVAVQRGYNVMLWNAMGSEGREREGVEAFIQRQVEAIVFTTPRTPANVELALKSGLEVVQVERPVGADSHMVLVDNYVGSRAAVDHLLALGHRRIGYLGRIVVGSPELVDNQRYRGYLDAMAAAGHRRAGSVGSAGVGSISDRGWLPRHAALDGTAAARNRSARVFRYYGGGRTPGSA